MSKSAVDELYDVIGGMDEHQGVDLWLDTGLPQLNKIISGSYGHGFPFGRIIEIFGPSQSGKTLLAQMAMIQAQKAGGIAMFNDHERRFVVDFSKRLGLKTDKPFWIYKKPKTWEESNTIALKAAELIRQREIIPKTAPICIVFDSVASMIPKSVFEKGLDEYNMNDTTALARVTSTTLKSVSHFVEELGVTAIYLNQIRTKPGVMYGDPTTTPGGSAMEFYASTRLSIGRKKIKQGDEIVGQEVTAKTVKNSFTRPFQAATWRLNFMEDGCAQIDYIGAMIDCATDNGLLNKSGAYIEWVDGKKYFRKVLVEKLEKDDAEAAVLRALFKD